MPPLFEGSPRELRDWVIDNSPRIGSLNDLGSQYVYTLTDGYLNAMSALDPHEWFGKVQMQAAMFNLGLVVSLHCLQGPMLLLDRSGHFKEINNAVFLQITKEGGQGIPIPTLYAIMFFERFFLQLKGQLCAPTSKARKMGAVVPAATISAWLTNSIGISEPIAVGFAALIVVVIASAARDTFCEITLEDFRAAIGADKVIRR